MIPDFKTFISESIWSDMQDRSSGKVIRKEDDVNHMNFDTFADYIEDNYSEKGDWFAIRESEDEKSRHIEIDIISGIDLSFNVVDGEIYNILINNNANKYIDVPGLKKIFNVNILGSSTFSVVEKDWTKSNNTFVKLIEFFLEKKTNESIWSDMQDRSTGETVRREDDIELLDRQGLVDYLKAHYKCANTTTIIPTIADGGNISVCLYEDGDGYLTYLMYEHIDGFRKLYVTAGFKESTDYAYNELKTNYTLTEIEDEDMDGHPISNIRIEPKGCRYENLTNKFFLEVLDFIIERIEKPLEKQIEKI